MDSTSPDLTNWVPQPISTQAYVLPVFSSLAIILLLIPFYYHASLGSVAPASLIFCTWLTNLITFINAILWPTDDWAHWYDGKILCDIQSKIFFPLMLGQSTATLCITRNLALMFDTNKQIMAPTRGMRLRKMWTDIAICFTIPILQIPLHYLTQDIRFYVGVLAGCLPSFDNSWPTIVIFYIWQPIFSLVNAYYAILVIVRLRKHRATALASLAAHSLPLSLFLRLLAMTLLLILLQLPVSIYLLYSNVDITWLSYDWTLVHQYVHQIYYLPILGIRTNDRWFFILNAFFIIIFLGIAGDALDLYRRILLRIPYMSRLFPSLLNPRVHHSNRSTGKSGSGAGTGNHTDTMNSRKGLLSRFSPMSRARAYFGSHSDTSTTGSKSTTCTGSTIVTSSVDFEMSGTRSELDSRKNSAVPIVEHVNVNVGGAVRGVRVADFSGVAEGGGLQTQVAGGARSLRNLDLEFGEVRVEKKVEIKEARS